MSVENNWAGAQKSTTALLEMRRQPLARFCQNWTRTSRRRICRPRLNIIERHARASMNWQQTAKAVNTSILNILRECSTSSLRRTLFFPAIWAPRYLTMNGRRRILGSFNHGSMANALPQAIGAQVSHPGRQVISFSGDGGLAMLMGDLLSLRQLQLPVKVIVFKNDALAFVELEMKA